MRLVVDANVLFSFFKKDSVTRKLVTSFELLDLSTPSFCIKELHKHKGEICEKAGISGEDFEEALENLELFINIIPDEEFKDFAAESKEITPHEKDAPYAALILSLKDKGYEIGLWTQESRLKELEKHEVKVYTTGKLLKLLELKKL